MLQLSHLDVSKVDQVLHMGCVWKAVGGVSNVQGGAGPLLVHSLASLMRWVLTRSLCGHRPDASARIECPDPSARIGRPGASKSEKTNAEFSKLMDYVSKLYYHVGFYKRIQNLKDYSLWQKDVRCA
jgi:hypothetical protein